MTQIAWLTALISCASLLLPSVCHPVPVRMKDIARVNGVRGNQLIGYGIVVGLNGTGDSASASFTYHSIVSMLEHMGITVSKEQISVNNVAAVMVTASLPPFAKEGSVLDVTVSSVGNASDLTGGMLLMTPLKGADGNVYAVAQGAISLGGTSAAAGAENAGGAKEHLTVGRIPEGATIEREVATTVVSNGAVTLTLRNPDFTTAARAAAAVNTAFKGEIAVPEDAGNVRVTLPKEYASRVTAFVADLETVEFTPDASARIVINERTGTIVAGERVRISKVAVSHGNMSIEIRTVYQPQQPMVYPQDGEMVQTPDGQGTVTEKKDARMMVMDESADIGKVSAALNAMGVTPKDMISIFQTMKEAGALQADLVVI